jgi:hypothetical protein
MASTTVEVEFHDLSRMSVGITPLLPVSVVFLRGEAVSPASAKPGNGSVSGFPLSDPGHPGIASEYGQHGPGLVLAAAIDGV